MQVIESNPSQVSSTPAQGMSAAMQRATAKLSASMNGEPAQTTAPQAQIRDLPVQNANRVSLEELSQISAQPDTNGETPAATEQPPVAPSPKEDPALSSQYAALARREKALRAQRLQSDQQFRAREEALKAREAALNPPAPTFDPSKYVLRDDLRKDPFSVLANEGLTYEQLVEQAINAPKPEEVKLQQLEARYEAKIKALEARLENTDKTIKEQETTAYQSAINQITVDVNNLVNRDPAFETIKVTGQQSEVVKLIEDVYKHGMGSEYPKGTALDPYEAAKMVEEEVAEYLYNTASKASKVASRFKPAAQTVAPANAAQKTDNKQPSSQNAVQMKTLTNQMNASRQLSARDRAILAANGQLKKQ